MNYDALNRALNEDTMLQKLRRRVAAESTGVGKVTIEELNIVDKEVAEAIKNAGG